MNLIVEENDIHLLHIRDMDDHTPAHIISGTRPGSQSGLTPKMARLIAAAPDLLAALGETLSELEALRDDLPHPRPTAESAVCHRARAAINKAQGKEEHNEP